MECLSWLLSGSLTSSVVEIDLTSPSMIPGKKGFDRLVYASKNALAEPISWLVCNISTGEQCYYSIPLRCANCAPALSPDPLAQHSPTKYTANPDIVQRVNAVIPKLSPEADWLSPGGREDFEDFSTGLYEWLSLVRLQSPRIEVGDHIDQYLSRYQVPSAEGEGKICKITWKGFLSPSWSRQTLIDILAALPTDSWFSFSATSFPKGLAGDTAECTVLRPPNSSGEYLMWEVKAHE